MIGISMAEEKTDLTRGRRIKVEGSRSALEEVKD